MMFALSRRRLLGLVAVLCVAAAGAVHAEAPPIRLALIEGLSGPFGNAGEAVHRNLVWAVERVNARGGVQLPDGAHRLELARFDSKGATGEALAMLRAAPTSASATCCRATARPSPLRWSMR